MTEISNKASIRIVLETKDGSHFIRALLCEVKDGVKLVPLEISFPQGKSVTVFTLRKNKNDTYYYKEK